MGEQQSMFKIVRIIVKLSEGKFTIVEALYFLDLEKFMIYWDLENFHALQNLENKWKLWTLKIFELSNLKNFMRGLDL